jgi:hypothetical protein
MEDNLDQERWHRLREEARRAAAARQEQAEQWTRAALETAGLALPDELERRLGQLNADWAVHEKPLLNRIPILGPFFAWLGARLVRFLLQNQVVYNAQTASLLQELHQVQRLLNREQLERTDDLFSRLDERLLALEARLKDLEEEVAGLREEG